jgi:saccharopepsin
MKLFAKTDPVKAASQVATIRGKTMAGMPPEIAPSTLIKLINGGAVAGEQPGQCDGGRSR